MRNNVGDSGFAHARRSPQYHGWNVPAVNGSAQYAAFAGKVLLANQLI